MKRILLILMLMTVAAPAWAQRLKLDFGNLADSASESVDVTLDGPMLKLALGFLNSNDPEERAARDMVKNLEGIYVRSFQFDTDNAYDKSIVTRVRSQLGPSWKKIVSVQSRTKENVEIYTDMRGETVAGLCIISAEPRELTLVNIVGQIDIARLSQLEGNFGIPHVTTTTEK